MALDTSITGEKRFDRGSWLTLAVVVVFALVALGTTLSILMLPTDGWQISNNDRPPPPLSHFAGDWPTPLQLHDQVLAVDGMRVGGGETLYPLASKAWQPGGSVTYTILRGGQRMDIPVTLHYLGLAGILRSLWYTVRDTPGEWSWSLIGILVFLLRPRSTAARLMLLAFVPHNATVKLLWAATTISHNFAPALSFYLYLFCNNFWFLFFPSIILLALSFPQRVFPLTRWPRAVPLLLYGLFLVFGLIHVMFFGELIATAVIIVAGGLLILAFGDAFFNARRVSQNAVARAQAVWVIFGFGLTFLTITALYLLENAGRLNLTSVGGVILTFIYPLVLPICLAIAVTRYHLFDIYFILRRTLKYTLLTLLLAVVYFGGVVVFQAAFRRLTGQSQDLAIVLSTLAIAALFTPLRRTVQNFLDRRFFRSKYDAEAILANFAASARNEVDLEPLTEMLLDVVDKTMQPKETALWLLKTGTE